MVIMDYPQFKDMASVQYFAATSEFAQQFNDLILTKGSNMTCLDFLIVYSRFGSSLYRSRVAVVQSNEVKANSWQFNDLLIP